MGSLDYLRVDPRDVLAIFNYRPNKWQRRAMNVANCSLTAMVYGDPLDGMRSVKLFVNDAAGFPCHYVGGHYARHLPKRPKLDSAKLIKCLQLHDRCVSAIETKGPMPEHPKCKPFRSHP